MSRITSASLIIEGGGPGEVHTHALTVILAEMGPEAVIMEVNISRDPNGYYYGRYLAVDSEFAEQGQVNEPDTNLQQSDLPELPLGGVEHH
jgi:hypothetical protein